MNVPCDLCGMVPCACPTLPKSVTDLVDAVENPVVIESTPHPGDGGKFKQLWDQEAIQKKLAQPFSFTNEYMNSPYCKTCGDIDCKCDRCPGCGKKPCVTDAKGCCPNQPDSQPSYMDDSWGDYERDPHE